MSSWLLACTVSEFHLNSGQFAEIGTKLEHPPKPEIERDNEKKGWIIVKASNHKTKKSMLAKHIVVFLGLQAEDFLSHSTYVVVFLL